MNNYKQEKSSKRNDEKAVKVILSNKTQVQEGLNTLIKQNNKKYIPKGTIFRESYTRSAEVVHIQCPGLKLNNNFIGWKDGLIKGEFLQPCVQAVNGIHNLLYLDLSFNYIRFLPEEFKQCVELQTLYLHKNLIYYFQELDRLKENKKLKNLSVHNNPIEEIDN